MKTAISFLTAFLICYTLQAQNEDDTQSLNNRQEQLLNTSAGTNGDGFLTTAAYEYNWGVGQKKAFRLGAGIRMSAFFGGTKYYRSAPPELYNDDEKADSIYIVERPQQNNIALYISAAYRIKQKVELGFNIDVIGYSFGAEKMITYVNRYQTLELKYAKPNSLSLLLVDANDRGMVNSQFWIGYQINNQWAIRGGVSHLFTEYKTNRKGPQNNDRFRGVNNIPFLAVRYAFN